MAETCLLCYITDRTAFSGSEPVRQKRLLEKIQESAYAGVDYIQVREKNLSTRDLEHLASQAISILTQLRTENRELRTALLINSRADVAMAVAADGVHLRSDDISPADVRALWCGADLPGAQVEGALAREAPLIGFSCHSAADVARAAAQGATFAIFGPVFEKKDFPDARPAGLSLLRQACEADIPVLAIGGITVSNARSCLQAGASGIAAIRLFQENDVAAVVKQLRG